MLTIPRLILLCFFGAVAPAAARENAREPAEFQFNPRAGDPIHGGTNSSVWSQFVESPRFRIFFKSEQSGTEGRAKTGLKHLEAAYECFTGELGWRSSGLSYNGNQEDGPFYKLNAFAVSSSRDIGGAGGVMGANGASGHSFMYVNSLRIRTWLTEGFLAM
jgi:hypothetical protein